MMYKRMMSQLEGKTYLTSLPTFKANSDYIQNFKNKHEHEVINKCVVCMSLFEEDEVLKTLPCCKYTFI
jgi:hypothetical protein